MHHLIFLSKSACGNRETEKERKLGKGGYMSFQKLSKFEWALLGFYSDSRMSLDLLYSMCPFLSKTTPHLQTPVPT